MLKPIHKKLLSGTAFLKKPIFKNFTQEDRLLRVVLMAYLKHHLSNDDIGWEELADTMHNEICNTIGDDAYCDWLDRMKGPEVET